MTDLTDFQRLVYEPEIAVWKLRYRELQQKLAELRRIEDAARAFLTACDEQGCSDAPLDEFCGLVEAVSRLPGPVSSPARSPDA